MTNFKNPENFQEYIEKIKSCPTLNDVTLLLNSIYPDWIIQSYPDFSKDYYYLKQNWYDTCKKGHVKPVAILHVNDYLEDDNHTLIRTFCEVYTASGFYVRKNLELQPCSKCGLAIMTKPIYDNFSVKIPEIWSDKCSKC
jgi:hypothetical protein